MLYFDWDDAKNRANRRKHGISFEEAQSVFFDERALEADDPEHSIDENRYLMIGRSLRFRLLMVCYSYRASTSTIRIITARRATQEERRIYERRGKR